MSNVDAVEFYFSLLLNFFFKKQLVVVGVVVGVSLHCLCMNVRVEQHRWGLGVSISPNNNIYT